MDPAKKPFVSNTGTWAMNVISSVGIIMANKQLMSSAGYGFCFATTLTAFHFAITGLVGTISKKRDSATSKQVPLRELLLFSAVANLSITAMNFSLMLNSVGFYQMSKLSIIPVVCFMEWVLNNKRYSTRVISSVFFVALGVGVCTVTDVNANGLGFVCACVAVFCTSLQQITIGSLQTKYSVGAFELLSKTAPIQAASLLLIGPVADLFMSKRSILDYQFSFGAVMFILLSCALAVFCNISQYMCIGRFSATSFQVLGHMKTVCVLVLGWVLFDSVLTLKNMLGMALAIAGMIGYSWAVEKDKQKPAKIAPLLPIKGEDEQGQPRS
ncbi:UDP-rhamnose/UDP-galactose transporter 2-like [Wolffia australiana]